MIIKFNYHTMPLRLSPMYYTNHHVYTYVYQRKHKLIKYPIKYLSFFQNKKNNKHIHINKYYIRIYVYIYLMTQASKL